MPDKIDPMSELKEKKEDPEIIMSFEVYRTKDGMIGFRSDDKEVDLHKVFNAVTELANYLQIQLQANATVNVMLEVQKKLQQKMETEAFARSITGRGKVQ